MKTFIMFLLGILFYSCEAVPAFAQTEVFLKPVAQENCPFYQNASAVDGIMAEMPDVDSTKYFSIFFDLGFTNAPNVSQTYKIYGDIPPGSNIKLAAIIDEANEGYGHRWVFIGQGRNDNGNPAVVQAACPMAYRHIALLRYSARTSSCPSCVPARVSVPYPTNGQPAFIDALSLVKNKLPVAAWKYPYSHFVINSSLFGKTVK